MAFVNEDRLLIRGVMSLDNTNSSRSRSRVETLKILVLGLNFMDGINLRMTRECV